ncbi:MAG: polyribonucleotide nucleotidyltransferase [Elusimicrobiota bacterium]
MKKITKEIDVGGRKLIIETGELAKQASGAVKVSYGETVVLATCCISKLDKDLGFFPLTVNYRERTYAAGKIPGGFFKREGKPQEKEIITSRLIDRPIRPLFPDNFNYEVQIIITVLSSDGENDTDIPAMIGGSCAVAISEAPVDESVGAVRIGKCKGEYVVNPTFQQIEDCEFEFVIAGNEHAITMMEGEGLECSEEEVLKSLDFAAKEIKIIAELQKEIIKEIDPDKIEIEPEEFDEDLVSNVKEFCESKIKQVIKNAYSKKQRREELSSIKKEAIDEFVPEHTEPEEIEEKTSQIGKILDQLEKDILREQVKEEGKRVDGRAPDELREINCEAGILPRTHGSGLFTKGETQSLAVTTLGTSSDQQIMDELEGEYKKHFMLHYNFPPYSVGEVRRMTGPGRREIGHGLLAEKALVSVLQEKKTFPYTIRVVSDILESNGSSSMATVCAGCISLMDAGVPLSMPVAGVGMGLIDDVILCDILGDEDHAGDMDFKVAGTRKGITAIQMDIKTRGIANETLRKVLDKAKTARLKTLDEIEKVISKPRDNISPYAPQISTTQINPDKIGALIGSGGKTIKKIQEETGSNIDIEDDGRVTVSADSKDNLDKALEKIKGYTEEVEPGKIYKGKVRKIMDFGAFVEILPGQDGLVHISELAPYHVKKVTDIVNEGDEILVKCINIDEKDRINLSRVKALSDKDRQKEKEQH